METSQILLLGATIVIAGNWSQGKAIASPNMIGVGFSAIFISILDNWVPELGHSFALLFLLMAAVFYLQPMLAHLGGKNTSRDTGAASLTGPAAVNPNRGQPLTLQTGQTLTQSDFSQRVLGNGFDKLPMSDFLRKFLTGK